MNILQPSIGYITALSGGILSFFSPCVLPLVPIIFAILIPDISKTSIVIKRGVGFFLGLSIFFTILGVISGSIGFLFYSYRWILNIIAGSITIFFGVIFLLDKQIFKGSKINLNKFKDSSFMSSFLMGFAVSIVWIPCSGPILGGILSMAATNTNILKAATLLFVYSLGISIPFLFLSGVISKVVSKVSFGEPKWQKYLKYIGGILLILIGTFILFGMFNKIF